MRLTTAEYTGLLVLPVRLASLLNYCYAVRGSGAGLCPVPPHLVTGHSSAPNA